jgi:nicotinamide-nucleotide amidase
MSLEQIIVPLLTKRKLTLCSAESCTGGLLAHRLTNIPGSSKVFKLGVVLYSNEAKSLLAKVPKKTLQSFGAVSEPVAIAMAKGIRKTLGSDYGIAITGIAGPSGGNSKKPVGLTYLAVSNDQTTTCFRYHFKGTRKQIKQQAATKALILLWKSLNE